MFQNLVAERNFKNKDVKVNNSIFSLKGIILCIISFLISTVSLKNGIAPFSFAILVAVCSSSVPAGPIFITTALGVLAGSGLEAFAMYIINIFVFILSIIIFRPIVQPDKNEISKLGKNLVISMAVTYFARFWFMHQGYQEYFLGLVNILLSYSFYKIFVNGFDIIDRIEYKDNSFASTLEELIAFALLFIIAASSFAKLGFIGAIATKIVFMVFIMVFSWRHGPLVGMTVASGAGLILGSVGVLEPVQILIFTIAGIWAGFFGGAGKVPAILVFLLFGIGINVILDPEYITLLNMIQYIISAVIVLFVPSKLGVPVEDLFRKYTAFQKKDYEKLRKRKVR